MAGRAWADGTDHAGIQAAGHGCDEVRRHEGNQLGGKGVDAYRIGQGLVVADSHESQTEYRVNQAVQPEQRQQQKPQGQIVLRRLAEKFDFAQPGQAQRRRLGNSENTVMTAGQLNPVAGHNPYNDPEA